MSAKHRLKINFVTSALTALAIGTSGRSMLIQKISSEICSLEMKLWIQ